ncbi:hypothetical protein DFH08DRAFT_822482 [Mycena albidolilacea]|uniref:Uncharacterized protein n=1 Tax=Mycena albidolilacea TaxID=1033008 RepID=A0AAD7EC62_9AGAR|nr:hypothetical protein DFH08DRAFT_822482 [Mycena albidolilacea]
MSCAQLAAHPRDERDTAGVCCGNRRRRRGPKGEGDGAPSRSLSQGRGTGKVTLSRQRRGAASSRPVAGSWRDGRAWALVDAANSGLGTCLACASARLQVWSSAGKPSAGSGALPKKGQGRRRFVSSALGLKSPKSELGIT